MKIITLSESTINIDDNATTTIILPVDPPIALKISSTDSIAIALKTLEVVAEQSGVPKEIVKIVRKNITETS